MDYPIQFATVIQTIYFSQGMSNAEKVKAKCKKSRRFCGLWGDYY